MGSGTLGKAEDTASGSFHNPAPACPAYLLGSWLQLPAGSSTQPALMVPGEVALL